MPRYLLDLDVESESTLTPNETALHVTSPSGEIDVSVSVARTDPREGTVVLSVQVVLDAEDIDTARDRGLAVTKDLLRAWSFTTSAPFRLISFRRVVNWTKGLRDRECIHFSNHPGDGGPHEVLNGETLLSAVRLVDAPLSPTMRRAIRWFSNGVASAYTDDQFYYFWLSVELVAIETKEPKQVHDACPKCRAPLYCRACNLEPTHRPYPKQAIQDLFRRHVPRESELFFSHADRFRNALMHGDDVEDLERTLRVQFADVVNALGRLAWAALLATAMKRMADAGATGELPVLQTNLFVRYQLDVGLNLVVTSHDPDNPSVADLPAIEVSVESRSNAT